MGAEPIENGLGAAVIQASDDVEDGHSLEYSCAMYVVATLNIWGLRASEKNHPKERNGELAYCDGKTTSTVLTSWRLGIQITMIYREYNIRES